MLLESRDHLVIDVEDGPSAIEVITREKPDVAFIDIGLPAMNGYEGHRPTPRQRAPPGATST